MQENSKKEEWKLTEEELLSELMPIFKEYFIARFRRTEQGIQIKFANGQKFMVTVCTA